MRAAFGGPVSLGAHVVAQSARIENVIPAAHLQHGHGDLGKMFLDGPLLPVVVIIGMRQPVEVIRRDHGSELCVRGQIAEIEDGIIGERKRRRADSRIGILAESGVRNVF